MGVETTKKTIRIRANFPSIARTITNHTDAGPGIAIGLNIVLKSLGNIADEAIQIKNPLIIRELYYLGIIELDEAEKKEYDIETV